MKELIRGVLLRGTETVLAIVLVLVFFLGFLAIMSFSFPQGTSLQDLMLRSGWSDGPEQGQVRLDMAGGEPQQGEPFVARLSQARRTVKNKRADAITWSDAESGMPLQDRHSVQTFSRSAATIAFGGDNRLSLGENSLIVIRSLEQKRASSVRRASMIILDGEIDGSLQATDAVTLEMEVVTAGGSTLNIPEDSKDSDFKVSVNPDKSSTFSVYSGTAEITSAGRTVKLRPNQAVTVAPSQPPSEPMRLPGKPSDLSPASGSLFTYRATPPRVRFRWDGDEATDGYRFVIARDPEFNDLVFDGRIPGPEFTHGNLEAGRYFWRVGGLAGWAEGAASAVHELALLEDAEPPRLSVAFPEGSVRERLLLLEGAVEPGAEVFIGDLRVPTRDSGEFEFALNLQRGLNVVVVEAVDAAGNIAYQSRLVSAKY